MKLKLISKNIIFSLFLLPLVAKAEIYELDAAHTSVQFSVKHFGINSVKGTFSGVKGTVDFDPKKAEEIKITAEINTDSLNTSNAKRDEHVKSKDFLDATKFPKMTFVSKSAKSLGNDALEVTGDLTILGNTKEIVLNIEDISGPGLNPMDKKNHVGASATAKLKRQDYGVTWNGGGLTGIAGESAIGDEIKIQIEVDAVK